MTLGLRVAPPTQADTRSGIADWLELQALCHPRGRATIATLWNVIDIASDNPTELDDIHIEDSDEMFDNDIAEEERNQTLENVFEELEYRQTVLGEAYPFQLDDRGRMLVVREGDPLEHIGRSIYIFCLIASCVRDNGIQPRTSIRSQENQIGNVFQVCACLAAGGYVGGEVASFGWPRATSTSFLPALRLVYERFGYPRVIDEFPSSYPDSVKDGGIDVIAWRDHPDSMFGKLYLIGQCASGVNWREKSVVAYIVPLHSRWFLQPPAAFSIPAMFIPFTMHREVGESDDEEYRQKVKSKVWFDESEFGIVFDRLRIAHYAHMCSLVDAEARSRIDGNDQIHQVQDWSRLLVTLLREGLES